MDNGRPHNASQKKRPSRAALIEMGADDDAPDVSEDLRATAFGAVVRLGDDEAASRIRAVLAVDATRLADDSLVQRLTEWAQDIADKWGEIAHNYVLIGRTLQKMQMSMSRPVFEAMIESRLVLPFGKGPAFQLIKVAKNVDNGWLPMEVLPGSYSIAYQLTTLTNDEIRKARSEGLLRVSVTRQEIQDFKKRVRNTTVRNALVAASLTRERAVLLNRRKRLADELDEVDARLADIDRLMGQGA